MAVPERTDEFVHVADLETVRAESPMTVRPAETTIVLIAHDEEVYAIDNRCPHMGFPLTEGTVDDGILTCHWHHARFELSCGDTLDPFADDVNSYPVQVDNGEVYVSVEPRRSKPPIEYWRERLDHGLQENISLVIAKASIGLESADAPHTTALTQGTMFGTDYNANGWDRGLTTLGVMANIYATASPEDRPRALYQGLAEVADACAGQPPFFGQPPLETSSVSTDRLTRWFRDSIDVRDSDGAERILRSAIASGASQSQLATMLVGAATDHLYLDTGHRLDFINKAFEMLDHIGWEHAEAVLPTLETGLANASRAEEQASWRQPIDLAALLFDTYDSIPAASEKPRDESWTPTRTLTDALLDDEPAVTLGVILDEIAAGAPPPSLAAAVVDAAAHRVAQFGTANEFRDWNTVHHTYSYANAVYGMANRTTSWEIYRGICDAAMSIYRDRFLNMPPATLPEPGDTDRAPSEIREDLQETFQLERDTTVDRAGQLVSEHFDATDDSEPVKATLCSVLLREDVGFHTRQNLEAALSQSERMVGPDTQRLHLVATARYLAAHTPTRRAGEQTFTIANRLHRGEAIHEAAASDGGCPLERGQTEH